MAGEMDMLPVEYSVLRTGRKGNCETLVHHQLCWEPRANASGSQLMPITTRLTCFVEGEKISIMSIVSWRAAEGGRFQGNGCTQAIH